MNDGERPPSATELGALLAEDRAAAQLLGVLAQMEDAPVPAWLLCADPDALPSPLSDRARAGGAAILAAARPLERRGWSEASEEALRLPADVAARVRERMSGREEGSYLRAATALLHAAFPERVGRPRLRGRCLALAPHVRTVAERAAGGGRTTAEAVHLLARLGAFHRSEGETAASLEAFRAARRVAGRGDPVGPDLLAVLADEEANALAALGRWEEAVGAVEELVGLAEEGLGRDDPRFPMLLANAAATLREGGEAAAAAELLGRALDAVERARSPAARPLAAELGGDRADALLAAGRPAEAVEAARKAGEAARSLGPGADGGPRAIRADWIRADALRELGRHGEATRLFRRALELQERALGPEHPDVAQKAAALARHLEDAGREAEAAEFYRRALDAFEASLGPESEAAGAARAGLDRCSGPASTG